MQVTIDCKPSRRRRRTYLFKFQQNWLSAGKCEVVKTWRIDWRGATAVIGHFIGDFERSSGFPVSGLMDGRWSDIVAVQFLQRIDDATSIFTGISFFSLSHFFFKNLKMFPVSRVDDPSEAAVILTADCVAFQSNINHPVRKHENSINSSRNNSLWLMLLDVSDEIWPLTLTAAEFANLKVFGQKWSYFGQNLSN